MAALDVTLRAGGASLLLALAVLLVLSRPRTALPWLYLLFSLGMAGFLAINTPDPALELPDGAEAVAGWLAGLATVFLWWFCLGLFDDAFRPGPVELGGGAAWVLVKLADRGVVPTPLETGEWSWLLMLLGLAMVGHIVWRAFTGRADDLVEPRRRLRLAVAGLLVGLLLADFAADLLLGTDWRGHGFALAQNASIGLIALGLAGWFLQVRPMAPPLPAPAAAVDADTPLLARIDALLADRAYLDPNLTLPDFARRLAMPEATVRRLIHDRLGHRHFRTFINTYRVAEAKARLEAEPEAKMIAIAFDSGFASLASFNRVFRELEGVSPTRFRAAQTSEAPLTRK